MRHIKLFESYLESSRAPLYHTTNLYFASQILDDDSIKHGKTKYGISLTRNKDLRFGSEDNIDAERSGVVTFKMDGEKLRNRYDIRPHDYFHSPMDTKKKWDPKRKTDVESEERIFPKRGFGGDKVVRDIDNLHKYLLEIQLDLSKILPMKNAKPDMYETADAYKDLVISIKNYVSKYGAKVTDYKGNSVDVSIMESLMEGIYPDLLGTRLLASKSADSPDTVDLYYTTYTPDSGGKSKLATKFIDHLKRNNIKYTVAGKNKLRMTNDEMKKLKKSLINLPSES